MSGIVGRLVLEHDRARRDLDDLAVGRQLAAELRPQVLLARRRLTERLERSGVEEVEEAVVGAALLLALPGTERILLRRRLDRVDRGGCSPAPPARLDVRVRRDHVVLEVVEVELRRGPDLLDRAVGVLDVWEPDLDLVGADPGDLGLGDAERVDALADDLDRAVDVLGCDLRDLRGRLALVDELGAAAQVEALHRRLLR